MKMQTGNGSKNIQRGSRFLCEERLNCTEYEQKLREVMSDMQRQEIDYLALSFQLTALLRKFDQLECSLQQKRDTPNYLEANQTNYVRMNKKRLQKTAASAIFEFQKNRKIRSARGVILKKLKEPMVRIHDCDHANSHRVYTEKIKSHLQHRKTSENQQSMCSMERILPGHDMTEDNVHSSDQPSASFSPSLSDCPIGRSVGPPGNNKSLSRMQ